MDWNATTKSFPNPKEDSTNRLPYLLISLVFFAMLPVTMIVPVLKDLIKDKHSGQNWEVALFMSLAMLGSFIFSPIAGYLSDRFKNRKGFITCFFFVDGLLIFLLSQVNDMKLLMTIRFLEGVAHIFVIGLLIAMITDRENDPQSPHYKQGKLMGILGVMISLGAAIGMPMGVIGKKDPMMPFYIGSAILVIMGFLSFRLQETEYIQNKKKLEFKELLLAFRWNALLWIPFAFNFIDRFTVGFLISSFNIHMRENLRMDAASVGIALSLVLLPMSLLSYPVATQSKKTKVIYFVLAGSLVYGLFLAIAGFVKEPIMLFPVLFFSGLGAGMMFVPSMMLANQMGPSHLKATVMSAFTGAGSLGFMLGPMVSVSMESFYESLGWGELVFPVLSTTFGLLEVGMVLICLPFLRKITQSKNI